MYLETSHSKLLEAKLGRVEAGLQPGRTTDYALGYVDGCEALRN